MPTLSQRMRWAGPPLNLDPWVEGTQVHAGRLGVILAALDDLGLAVESYASCVCELAANVENLPEWGGDGGGPGPGEVPPWDAAWGCPGRTTVLYAPSNGWGPRYLSNGNVVPDQYWHYGIILGGALAAAVQFSERAVDIDEEGPAQPQDVPALSIGTASYAIPNTACMRADGSYDQCQSLYFQRLPLVGSEIGSTNDQDYVIPQFNFTLPNNNDPDPGLMPSPGFRSLKSGYAYVLYCRMDAGVAPDFDVYWGF